MGYAHVIQYDRQMGSAGPIASESRCMGSKRVYYHKRKRVSWLLAFSLATIGKLPTISLFVGLERKQSELSLPLYCTDFDVRELDFSKNWWFQLIFDMFANLRFASKCIHSCRVEVRGKTEINQQPRDLSQARQRIQIAGESIDQKGKRCVVCIIVTYSTQ
jgi:hypothetical protein